MRGLMAVCGVALAIAACNRADDTVNNDMAADNMMVEDNAMAGGMDANLATNGATEANMVMNDLTHNDADTNLANGM